MKPRSHRNPLVRPSRTAAVILAAAVTAATALLSASPVSAEPPPGVAMDSSAWELYYEAQHLETAEGDLRGASALYDRILESEPANRDFVAEVLYRQGVLLEKLDREKEARRNYEKILTSYGETANIVKVARLRLIKIEERANSLSNLNVHFDFEDGPGSFILYDWGDDSADLTHSTGQKTREGSGALRWRTLCGPDSYNAIYLAYRNPKGTLGSVSFWIHCSDQPAFLNLYIREKDQSTYDVGYFEVPAHQWVNKVFDLEEFRLTTAYYDENSRIDFNQVESLIIEDATGYHDTTTGHTRSLRGSNIIFLDEFSVSPLDGIPWAQSADEGDVPGLQDSVVDAAGKKKAETLDDLAARDQDLDKGRDDDQPPTERDDEKSPAEIDEDHAAAEEGEKENVEAEKKDTLKEKEKIRKRTPSLGTRVPRRPFPLPNGKIRETERKGP